MKLAKEYSDKLTINSNINDPNYCHGVVHLNENKSKQILKDVNVIEFNYLYFNIIVGLYDNNMFGGKYTTEVERIRNFLTNRESYKKLNNYTYTSELVFSNSFFGVLIKNDIEFAELISQYAKIMWNDIQSNNNSDDIIYIDTDMIFYKNDLNIRYINSEYFPYETKKLSYLWMEGKKKYVYLHDNKIKSKGFYFKSGRIDNIGINIESLLRSEQRSDKIGQLLNI